MGWYVKWCGELELWDVSSMARSVVCNWVVCEVVCDGVCVVW